MIILLLAWALLIGGFTLSSRARRMIRDYDPKYRGWKEMTPWHRKLLVVVLASVLLFEFLLGFLLRQLTSYTSGQRGALFLGSVIVVIGLIPFLVPCRPKTQWEHLNRNSQRVYGVWMSIFGLIVILMGFTRYIP